jgi:hypothetical protein
MNDDGDSGHGALDRCLCIVAPIDMPGFGGRPVSDTWQGPGYWMASNGKWYSPEVDPSSALPVPPSPMQASGASPPLSFPVQNAEPNPGSYWATAHPKAAEEFGLSTDVFALGPTTPPQRRRNNRRLLGWGSVGLAALVVAVVVLVGVSGQNAKWDPRILGIVHFDEQHRGLTFKEPVKVEYLDNAQFK